MTTLFWFRQDLRLSDNPALTKAVDAGQVIPIYILEQGNDLGAASMVWLHHSLNALDKSLGHKLSLFRGNASEIITDLCQQHSIDAVYWNRCYEPWRIKRDSQLKQDLTAQNVTVHSDSASLLWEPWEVLKKDGTPYKVFTPYYRRGCLNAHPPRQPLPAPDIGALHTKLADSLTINDLQLLPKLDWHQNMMSAWQVGEQAALDKLDDFLLEAVSNYKQGRDYPALQQTSRLSPHLHYGEISPNQVWYAVRRSPLDSDRDHFLSEIGWREFSYYLLYHFPQIPQDNFQAKFDNFPWRKNSKRIKAWQQGQTGYPIVDAGMRELWQTGYMHNRIRMVVGSFLVKNLLQHWHHGADWFWDCLLDADLASNSASWQWVAGCGADAAPYFRIFNPVTQGEKFDALGEYTKHYVPELSELPAKYLYRPWEAPENVLSEAGILLGKTYPKPIIDLKQSRQDALNAYATLKANAESA